MTEVINLIYEFDQEQVEVSWYIDRTPIYDYYRDMLIDRSLNTNQVPSYQIFINVDENVTINDEQQDCCICMENKKKEEITILNCNHTFCGLCVKDTIKSYKTKNNDPCCPMCRSEIEYMNVKTYKMKFIINEENLCF